MHRHFARGEVKQPGPEIQRWVGVEMLLELSFPRGAPMREFLRILGIGTQACVLKGAGVAFLRQTVKFGFGDSHGNLRSHTKVSNVLYNCCIAA